MRAWSIRTTAHVALSLLGLARCGSGDRGPSAIRKRARVGLGRACPSGARNACFERAIIVSRSKQHLPQSETDLAARRSDAGGCERRADGVRRSSGRELVDGRRRRLVPLFILVSKQTDTGAGGSTQLIAAGLIFHKRPSRSEPKRRRDVDKPLRRQREPTRCTGKTTAVDQAFEVP